MQKKLLILVSALILISIMLIVNPATPLVGPLAGIVQSVFSVPKAVLTGMKTDAIQDDNVNVDGLKEENRRLSEKLIEFEKVKRDNEALRSQFESTAAPDYRTLPAKVIGFLGKFSFPSSLIIDKGSLDGVNDGMAVIVDNNLVGRIKKTSGQYSEIVLVTNSSFSGLARSAEGNAPGIMTGASDFIVFDRVDVNETLTVGEILLSKGEIDGQGVGIPPDLIVGKIASVNKSEALPFQSAKIESLVQFSKLDTVFIVLGL